MKKLSVLAMLIFAVLLAVPAVAADRIITNGSDLWATRGDGSTFADFSKSPIPAGFFCHNSEPFTGRIVFRGDPLVTGEPGVLGRTDTIVQRLDDAVFNKRGVATTRIQVRSLSFLGTAPIKTSCGLFKVRVVLHGEQPVTTMRIVRDNQKGGRYFAPIGVNLRMVFEPAVVQRGGEVVELTRSFLFPAAPDAKWSYKPGPGGIQRTGFVLTDTDGDRQADTYLPGTSNFAAGWNGLEKAASTTCHVHVQGNHCVTTVDEQQPILD